MGYVYKITNTVNGKAYIGISIREPIQGRIKAHLSGQGNRLLARAIKKYGQDAFTYEVLESNVFDEFLPELEVAYIANYNTVAPHGYNLTYGGEGAGRPCDETRERMSEARRNKKRPPFSEAHRKNISKSLKKSKRFKESRRKISENTKKRREDKIREDQAKPIVKIRCAAAYFVFVSRDINEIAETFGTSDRTIRRWTEDPEWETALEACGYTGDKSFETQPYRDTERDAGQLFEKAREAYILAVNSGEPKHRWATIAAEVVHLPRRRVHDWAMKHGWRGIDS